MHVTSVHLCLVHIDKHGIICSVSCHRWWLLYADGAASRLYGEDADFTHQYDLDLGMVIPGTQTSDGGSVKQAMILMLHMHKQ